MVPTTPTEPKDVPIDQALADGIGEGIRIADSAKRLFLMFVFWHGLFSLFWF